MATGDKEGNAPGAWSLYGSNDNVKWAELDNRIRQEFEKREKKFLELRHKEAYQYYKLTIHRNQGGKRNRNSGMDVTDQPGQLILPY